MLQSDPSERPVGISHSILPPHFIGGVARSRHDATLAASLEKQAVQRAAILARQPSQTADQLLWRILLQVARRAAAVWWPQHGCFEIDRPRSALK
ncbi:MAG TPA: hypothetical protein VJV39_03850 [Dongiaceae bacterium]|nr:hypothetical protein [Dongiaceae bacterium]